MAATRVLEEKNRPQPPEPTEGSASEGTVEKPLTVSRPAHFVPVAEEELDRAPEDTGQKSTWLQTLSLAAVLAMIAAGIWWFLQPPTADALYERIAAKAADKTIGSLRDARGDIRDFLDRFPSSSHAKELRGYERELELDDLEREFSRRLRLHASTDDLAPVQRDYLEATNYDPLNPDHPLNPERGIARLEAFVNLYDQADDTGPTGACLSLARRRLAQLHDEVARRAGERLGPLEQRLKSADELRASDPDRARKIYFAAIELYGDKPWAAEAVGHAREALKALDAPADKKP